MEPNNSLMNQLALDFKRGINSFSIRAALFLLGMWLFPSLPMRFSLRIS